MLKLDGKTVKIEDRSNNPIIEIMNLAWKQIKDRFDLDNGGHIRFIYDNTKFQERIPIYDESGEATSFAFQYPSMMMLSLNCLFVDEDNDTHSITYYERESPINGGNGGYLYSPISIEFNGSLTYSSKDKELIMFLLMFCPEVTSIIGNSKVNILTDRRNRIIIEDLRKGAIEVLDEEGRKAHSYIAVTKMIESQLRGFAKAIGINGAPTKDLNMLKTEVLTKVRLDSATYDKIIAWGNNDIEGIVMKDHVLVKDLIEQALLDGKIKCSVYIPGKSVNWYYTREGEEKQLIFSFNGTKKNVDEFAEYCELHKDVIEKLKG